MHGKELEGLSLKDLQQLEEQLEMGLRSIRSQKVYCMLIKFYSCLKSINYLVGFYNNDQ